MASDLFTKPRNSPCGKVKDFHSFCIDRLGVCQNDRASQVPSPRFDTLNDLPLPILFQKDGVVAGLKDCFCCGDKHRLADCEAQFNRNCVTMNRTWHSDFCKGSKRENFSDARFFAARGNGLDAKNPNQAQAQQADNDCHRWRDTKSCKFGDKCRFSHDGEPPGAPAPAPREHKPLATAPPLLKVHSEESTMPNTDAKARAQAEKLLNVMPADEEDGCFTVHIPGRLTGKFIGSKAVNLMEIKEKSGVDDIQVGDRDAKNPNVDREVILIGNGATIRKCRDLVDAFLAQNGCRTPQQQQHGHQQQHHHRHHHQGPPPRPQHLFQNGTPRHYTPPPHMQKPGPAHRMFRHTCAAGIVGAAATAIARRTHPTCDAPTLYPHRIQARQGPVGTVITSSSHRRHRHADRRRRRRTAPQA